MWSSDDGRRVDIESAVEVEESEDEDASSDSWGVVRTRGGGLSRSVVVSLSLTCGRARRRSDIVIISRRCCY